MLIIGVVGRKSRKAFCCFALVWGIGVCFGCDKNPTVSKLALAGEPVPTILASNANEAINGRKYHDPSENCRKIKIEAEHLLCKAIVDDQDLGEQALTSEFIYTTKRVDLNGDGRDETIVWIPTPDLGGTSGYPILIFTQTGDHYQKVWDIDQAWTPILVLKSKSNGWRDIAFQYGGGGASWHYAIFKYNKKSYKLRKTQRQEPKGEMLIDKDWNRSIFGPVPNQ